MSDSACPVRSSRPSDVLVLSLGNPLRGDDGIGTAVVEALNCAELPQGVALLDGSTAGLDTVLLMQGYRRVIIVDAADIGCSPGEWVRLMLDDVSLQPDHFGLEGTLHKAGLVEALELGMVLGILPAEVVIYGVQPQEVGWSQGLSEPVHRSISPICKAILEELQNEESSTLCDFTKPLI